MEGPGTRKYEEGSSLSSRVDLQKKVHFLEFRHLHQEHSCCVVASFGEVFLEEGLVFLSGDDCVLRTKP